MSDVQMRVANALKFEGMTTAQGLILMDVALNRLRQRRDNDLYFEFGTYKGRTSALIAQNLKGENWFHAVESHNHLEESRIAELSNSFTWHKTPSEEFCAKKLPSLVGRERRIGYSHHDASHFFDNVSAELVGVLDYLREDAVIVLDDFNDSYSQVRAAYYHLRYTAGFPFELLVIGYNKAILVHEARFAEAEAYVLDQLLDDLEESGAPSKLCRTEMNQHSRNFFVRARPSGDAERYYGVAFFGERFYQRSA